MDNSDPRADRLPLRGNGKFFGKQTSNGVIAVLEGRGATWVHVRTTRCCFLAACLKKKILETFADSRVCVCVCFLM